MIPQMPVLFAAQIAVCTFVAVTTCGAVSGAEQGPPQPGLPLRIEHIRPRPEGALTGSGFAGITTDLPGSRRQHRAVQELTGGNVPEFLRTFVPVRLTHPLAPGDTLVAVIWVAPDYLAIGSDQDFLRIPLTYSSSTAVATEFGCSLPTRKMVDAIHEQAEVKLQPLPMRPGPLMRTMGYYVEHQRRIEEQRAGAVLGQLISGDKKDIVLTNRLWRKPGRIAIYGWHRVSGEPIQPLSTVHAAEYADYSHGLRLVWGQVWIGGRLRPLLDVLQDPEVAPVLTYEGLIDGPRKLMGQPVREP